MRCRLMVMGFLLVFIVGGCAPQLVGTYSASSFAKHPWVLTVDKDGTYVWEQMFTGRPRETGQWWKIEGQIILLLPHDSSKKHRFAKVQGKDLFGRVILSEDIRQLMDTGKPHNG